MRLIARPLGRGNPLTSVHFLDYFVVSLLVMTVSQNILSLRDFVRSRGSLVIARTLPGLLRLRLAKTVHKKNPQDYPEDFLSFAMDGDSY